MGEIEGGEERCYEKNVRLPHSEKSEEGEAI